MPPAVAHTFHENAILDEETGVAANNNSQPPSSPSPTTNGRNGWIIAGTVALILIIGLSVGMSTSNNGSDTKITEASAAAPPRVPTDAGDVIPPPSLFPDSSKDVAAAAAADDDEPLTAVHFDPKVEIGGSALFNWPEVNNNATYSPPPTLSPNVVVTSSPPATSDIPPITVASLPTTSEPTSKDSISPPSSAEPSKSPSKTPTLRPSKSPTNGPSSTPSASPSKSPSSSPSKEPTSQPTEHPTPAPSSSPSKSPTYKPVITLNLSAWESFNWNMFDPSASPSKSPTTPPTKMPTPQPTPVPTRQPTLKPSKQPTPLPTKNPTNEPTPPPTKNPTNQPTPQPSPSPTSKPVTGSPTEPFFFGDEFVTYENLGIKVSKGLSVRVIAETGEPVQFVNGDKSKLDYHTKSDGAGIISMDPTNPLESGYVYVANSEEGDGDGGVYGLYFDKDGNIINYKALLTKTTDNCGGGLTPWHTWVSCEEYEDGQCWQVDPINERAEETELGGSGGRYESVAVDNRNPDWPIFFTTEDHERGALRRFLANGNGWDALHTNGKTTFLNIIDGNTFEWTTNEADGRDSAEKYFRNSEGIQFHEGKLYFMAKKDLKMLILDLENMTYVTETTGKKFYGEGSFENQPDQNLFGPTRKYIYFTEDGGDSPGVYARYGNDGTYFAMFEAIKGGVYADDETVGIALSPDHKRFYAGIQDYGVIFEFTRDDGLPFE